MKAGDKLYCTKTLIHHGRIFFLENKLHKIESADNYNIEIINDMSNLFLSSNFHLSPFNADDDYNFYDYFMTETAYRKLKLKKLNESRR
jgi:hypothetical protein